MSAVPMSKLDLMTPPVVKTIQQRSLLVGLVFGAMPDYASQIAPRDRWAIVAYIRALQLSQDASAADVPAGQKVPSEPPRFEELGSGATLPVVETKPAHEEPK